MLVTELCTVLDWQHTVFTIGSQSYTGYIPECYQDREVDKVAAFTDTEGRPYFEVTLMGDDALEPLRNIMEQARRAAELCEEMPCGEGANIYSTVIGELEFLRDAIADALIEMRDL